MQVGELYSCKWRNRSHNTNCPNEIRGWDMLILIRVDYVDDVVGRYVFYDVIHGVERNMSRNLARHCKEITLEEQ